MPLDLEEQEQLDQFKAFWQKYRNLITGVLTVALFAFAAYNTYGWWQNSQALEASKLYETMISAAAKGDQEQTLRAANDLQKDFARTPYAAMSSLIAARVADAGRIRPRCQVVPAACLPHARNDRRGCLAARQ